MEGRHRGHAPAPAGGRGRAPAPVLLRGRAPAVALFGARAERVEGRQGLGSRPATWGDHGGGGVGQHQLVAQIHGEDEVGHQLIAWIYGGAGQQLELQR
jgi:hypothetical protein